MDQGAVDQAVETLTKLAKEGSGIPADEIRLKAASILLNNHDRDLDRAHELDMVQKRSSSR